MSISKTRQLLVDVARQLFAKKGLENTTMNDIAQASGKGRRTLYTYFKSKEDIYYAVIETELERLSDKLDEVAARKISPQEKVIELIYTHLSMIKETVVRNGNLRAEFFRNIWMVEKVRKHFDLAEVELFRKVFAEGKEDGEFDIENVNLVAWESVAKDKKEALVTVVTVNLTVNGPQEYVKAKGLGPETMYHVDALDITVSGSALMNSGLPVPREVPDYSSFLYHITKA